MDGGDGSARIVLLGPPGCGKGTQAEILAERLGIAPISTGEMLRAAVAAGSDLGKKVEAVMAAGDLVDDDLMAEVVRARMTEEDAREGFLLDGYPRTPSQAATLDGILEERQQSLDHVILIEVPEEVLVERALARQRADDKEEVVRERLRVYHQKTEPLVAHYRERSLLRSVDGDDTIEEVSRRLQGVVE